MWSRTAVDRKSAEVENSLLKTWKVRLGPPWCASKLSYLTQKMQARLCYKYTQVMKITIQGNNEYRISKRKAWHWHFYRQFFHPTQQLPLRPIVLAYGLCRMVRCVFQQQFPLRHLKTSQWMHSVLSARSILESEVGRGGGSRKNMSVFVRKMKEEKMGKPMDGAWINWTDLLVPRKTQTGDIPKLREVGFHLVFVETMGYSSEV